MKFALDSGDSPQFSTDDVHTVKHYDSQNILTTALPSNNMTIYTYELLLYISQFYFNFLQIFHFSFTIDLRITLLCLLLLAGLYLGYPVSYTCTWAFYSGFNYTQTPRIYLIYF